MLLRDLNPTWWGPTNRFGVAVIFDCPCSRCQTGQQTPARLVASLDPPLDGGPSLPLDGPTLSRAVAAGELLKGLYVGCSIAWKRTGDTFDTLTLSPSLNYAASHDWHGWIRQGEIT